MTIRRRDDGSGVIIIVVEDTSPMVTASSCRSQLERALLHIAPQIDRRQIDKLALLIDSSMQHQTRHYHTLNHALMVADSDDALEILIGLCHDIAQVGVDSGLPILAEPWLVGLIRTDESGNFALVDDERTRADQTFDIVRTIFNLLPGQTLTYFSGKNEFLSALVAAKIIEYTADPSTIAALAVGVEATIPFRSDPDGVAQRALDALEDVNLRHRIGLSIEQRREHVRRSIRIANRDVSSFASENLLAFLDETWNLIRESSADLSNCKAIKLDDYRVAVQKMMRFLGSLKAPNVFRRFDGEPSANHHRDMLSATSENLSIISSVMEVKLLAVGLLEATTTDLSAAYLSPRITSRCAAPSLLTLPRTVETILAVGKDSFAEFDIYRSPLAHQIISTMSAAEIKQLTSELSDRTQISKTLLTQVPAELSKQAKELAGLMTSPRTDD